MKIRIQDNSIRLRLTQSEVRHFGETGRVEVRTQFGSSPDETLIYSIEKGSTREMGTAYSSNHIKVIIPEKMAGAWVSTDEVGMEHYMDLGNGSTMRILVEKDFKCLTDRKGEDESDHFPNPSESC